jgi:hypothetical protein
VGELALCVVAGIGVPLCQPFEYDPQDPAVRRVLHPSRLY